MRITPFATLALVLLLFQVYPGAVQAQLSGSPASTTIASHSGIIYSSGANDDTGTFITFDEVNGAAPIDVSYKYCYRANSNGRSAQIRTVFDGANVDAFGFTLPSTGTGTCDKTDASTFGTRSFTVNSNVANQIRFDYTNGDYQVIIADILVAGEPVVDPGLPDPLEVPDAPELPTASEYLVKEWAIVRMDGPHPSVRKHLPWDAQLFDLTIDLAGYANPGDAVHLTVHADSTPLMEFTEIVEQDYGDIVVFHDVPANVGAEYSMGLEGLLRVFDPFTATAIDAVPFERDPCSQDDVSPSCEVVDYVVTCLSGNPCSVAPDACVQASQICEVAALLLACLDDPDCPDVSDPCDQIRVPGLCGPLPNACQASPEVCESVNDLLDCATDPNCVDVEPCDYLYLIPGLCGSPPFNACEVANDVCLLVQELVDCINDPDCPDVDECQYLGGTPGFCGNPVDPCILFITPPPGTCGEPGPDPCDIYGFLPGFCGNPPLEPCDELRDPPPGVCGEPIPRACDLLPVLCDPPAPCEIYGFVPGLCGNPWPEPCEAAAVVCELVNVLGDCVPIKNCLPIPVVPDPCDEINCEITQSQSCAGLRLGGCSETDEDVLACVYERECVEFPPFLDFCRDERAACVLVQSLIEYCNYESLCPGIQDLIEALAHPIEEGLTVPLPTADDFTRDGLTSPTTQSAGASSFGDQEIARYDGVVTSGDSPTGVLWVFDGVNANAPVEVTYSYCYLGPTHGVSAEIDTWFGGAGKVNDFSFVTPYTGGGTCQAGVASAFATRAFTVSQSASNQIFFSYANGDHRVQIASIVIRAAGGNGPGGDQNTPPRQAEAPQGPSPVERGSTPCYKTRAYDDDGDYLRYEFHWGDGQTSTHPSPGSWPNNQYLEACHQWATTGTKVVTVRAYDHHGEPGPMSGPKYVSVTDPDTNRAPTAPTLEGPRTVWVGTDYPFRAESSDPDQDGIQYEFRWSGDNGATWNYIFVPQYGYVDSGTPKDLWITWTTPGTKLVEVRAIDLWLGYSDTSNRLVVNAYEFHDCDTVGSNISPLNAIRSETEEKPYEYPSVASMGRSYRWTYEPECAPAAKATADGAAVAANWMARNSVGEGPEIITAAAALQGNHYNGGREHYTRIYGLRLFYGIPVDENNAPAPVTLHSSQVFGRSSFQFCDGTWDQLYGDVNPFAQLVIEGIGAVTQVGLGISVGDYVCEITDAQEMRTDGGVPGIGRYYPALEAVSQEIQTSAEARVEYKDVGCNDRLTGRLRATFEYDFWARNGSRETYDDEGKEVMTGSPYIVRRCGQG